VLRIVAAGGFLVACADHASAPPPSSPLELTIATDRASYASGEEVALTLAIHNRGSQSLAIVHPDFWGVTELVMTDDRGKAVESHSFKGERKAVADVMTIPAGETRSHVVDHLTAWTCCYGYTFEPLPPGRYQLVAKIVNPPVKVTPPAGWSHDWTGTLVSPPLAIEIR